MELVVMTTPGIIDIEVVLKEVGKDLELQKIIETIKKNLEENTKYQWVNDRLLYEGRLMISEQSSLIPTLLHTFHDSILGGHSRFLRTYKPINGELHWKGMKTDINNYLEQRDKCQRNKTELTLPAGLLQPIPLLELILEDWSMDFVEGLPMFGNVNVIVLVVDRLSKYAYFVTLKHPLSAEQVA